MDSMRFAVILLGIVAFSEAFLEFEYSRVYDELDFEGKEKVDMPLYCSSGCQIYVSIPDASIVVAMQIFIEAAPEEQINLYNIDKRHPDGPKIPYNVEEGNAELTFINKNDGLRSAPILVWIIRGDAPNQEAVVYDAYGMIGDAAPGGIITMLGVDPFSLIVLPFDGPFPIQAITAGFDALGSKDKCTRVIHEDDISSYDHLQLDIRSPLFTVQFNSDDTSILLSSIRNGHANLDLNKALFVASPGYIGCDLKSGEGRTKTFRSSLYEDVTEYDIKSDQTVSFKMSADLNVDQDHAVEILDDGESPLLWTATDSNKPIFLNAKEMIINWTRNADDLDQFFMIKVTQDLELKTTPSEPPPILATIEQSTTDAIKTTAIEPTESDTTATAPEEPIDTTTEFQPETEETTTIHNKDHNDKATTRSEPTAAFPPKSTAAFKYPTTVRTTTMTPTTSGASYDSYILSIVLATTFLM